MLLLHEYRPDHPNFKGHIRITSLMILMPGIVALFFMSALGKDQPWLWGVAGLSVGILLILFGGLLVHEDEEGFRLFTRGLHETKMNWFPPFLVLIQSLSTYVTILFLWFTITYFFPSPFYLHVFMVLTVVMIHPRRLISIRRKLDPMAEHTFLEDLIGAVFNILLIMTIASSVQVFSIGENLPEKGSAPVASIFLWITASVLMIINLVLLIHHALQARAAHLRREQIHTAD